MMMNITVLTDDDDDAESDDDDVMLRILNSRLTQEEYEKVSAADRIVDDNKGDYEFTLKNESARGEFMVRS